MSPCPTSAPRKATLLYSVERAPRARQRTHLPVSRLSCPKSIYCAGEGPPHPPTTPGAVALDASRAYFTVPSVPGGILPRRKSSRAFLSYPFTWTSRQPTPDASPKITFPEFPIVFCPPEKQCLRASLPRTGGPFLTANIRGRTRCYPWFTVVPTQIRWSATGAQLKTFGNTQGERCTSIEEQNNSGAGLGLDSKVCCGYESLLFGKCVRWRARGATDSTCLSRRLAF